MFLTVEVAAAMFDAEKMLGSVLNQGVGRISRSAMGNLGGIAGNSAKAGGLALLGGVAFAAVEHFMSGRRPSTVAGGMGPTGFGTPQPVSHGQPGMAPPPPPPAIGHGPGGGVAPPPPPPPFGSVSAPPPGLGAPTDPSPAGLPPPSAAIVPAGVPATAEAMPQGPEVAVLLVRAMIAAAKADGTIDADERARIVDRFGDLDAEERAFLEAEMAAPLDLDGLIGGVTDPALQAEVYAASLMAIDLDTPAEKLYLQLLAAKLGLPKPAVDAMHDRVGAPRV